MINRVILFIDSQNVYMRARAAFGMTEMPSRFGQIDPLATAQLISKKFKFQNVVKQIRIYKGIPSNKRDPKGYAAVRKQTAAWTAASELNHVTLRTLQYIGSSSKDSLSPREKGIDVAIAVDYVRLALTNEFDTGIIFSMDTDLKPALEFIGQNYPKINIGFASWLSNKNGVKQDSSINITNVNLHNIKLDRADYEEIKDLTSYSR